MSKKTSDKKDKKIKALKSENKTLKGELQKLRKKLKSTKKVKTKKAVAKKPKKKKKSKKTSKAIASKKTKLPATSDHSSNYNVRDGLAQMQSLTSTEEVEAFTEGENRSYIVRAIPAKIRKLQKGI